MEIWKDINGYCGYYEISNIGRVKSKKRQTNNSTTTFMTKEIILKSYLNKAGYPSVALYVSKKKKSTVKVHRLVAKVFISNPHSKKTVNHINGIKTDNRVENLEWATHKENMQHAFETGLIPNYNRKPILLLTVDDEPLLWFNSVKEAILALKLKLNSASNISSCLSGKRNKTYGYKWQFYVKQRNKKI